MAVRISREKKEQKTSVGSQRAIEREIMSQYLQQLDMTSRTTALPIVVCMVGLVGAGKSTVAREIAKHLGGTVVESDRLRTLLREKGQGYGSVRALAEQLCVELLSRGSNVVLDSDFIDRDKRESLARKLRGINVRLAFVRVVCDLDRMIGRIVTAAPDDFFEGASSTWNGERRGVVVNLREMIRRMGHHYQFEKEGGGRVTLRKSPFRLDAVLDTGTPDWREAVASFVKQLT